MYWVSAMRDVSSEPLQILDPFLPLLASEAALELDGILLEQSLPAEPAARRLADLLRVSFFDTEAGSTSFIDSRVLSIIGGAMKAARWSSAAIDTAAQFLTLGRQLSEQMCAANAETDPNVLKQLREFCIQLSRFAIQYRQRLYPVQRGVVAWPGGLSDGAAALR